ncbi:hypothetical protein F9K79_05300 [Ochrobactrum sp. Kaboul]|nr:hypothetical protein F9K79_05300 [Ochrobactrum sp. Kaboul]
MIRPRENGNYQDRGADCQDAVVDDVIELIERAQKAGWSGMEAAVAVGIIARGLIRDQMTVVIDNENP